MKSKLSYIGILLIILALFGLFFQFSGIASSLQLSVDSGIGDAEINVYDSKSSIKDYAASGEAGFLDDTHYGGVIWDLDEVTEPNGQGSWQDGQHVKVWLEYGDETKVLYESNSIDDYEYPSGFNDPWSYKWSSKGMKTLKVKASHGEDVFTLAEKNIYLYKDYGETINLELSDKSVKVGEGINAEASYDFKNNPYADYDSNVYFEGTTLGNAWEEVSSVTGTVQESWAYTSSGDKNPKVNLKYRMPDPFDGEGFIPVTAATDSVSVSVEGDSGAVLDTTELDKITSSPHKIYDTIDFEARARCGRNTWGGTVKLFVDGTVVDSATIGSLSDGSVSVETLSYKPSTVGEYNVYAKWVGSGDSNNAETSGMSINVEDIGTTIIESSILTTEKDDYSKEESIILSAEATTKSGNYKNWKGKVLLNISGPDGYTDTKESSQLTISPGQTITNEFNWNSGSLDKGSYTIESKWINDDGQSESSSTVSFEVKEDNIEKYAFGLTNPLTISFISIMLLGISLLTYDNRRVILNSLPT